MLFWPGKQTILIFLFLIVLWVSTLPVSAQISDSLKRNEITYQVHLAAEKTLQGHQQTGNRIGPSTNFAEGPSLLINTPTQFRPAHSGVESIFNQLPSLRSLNTLCKDTSFNRLIGVQNAWMYARSVTKTMDGGMLVPIEMYDSAQLPNQWSKTYGLIVKLDADGNVTWLKKFTDPTVTTYDALFLTHAFELSNGDIICTGFSSTNPSSSVYKTRVYRLTSTGTLLWQTTLQTNLGMINSPQGTFTYFVESAEDGLNGDVILCGTSNSNLSSGKVETVVRLNNQGQRVWDANYKNYGYDGSYRFGAEGTSAFMKNGQLIMVGLNHGTNSPQIAPAVNILTLDYNNGNLLTKRFFRPDYGDDNEEFRKSFTYWSNKFTRLSNGHYVFYGRLFSDFMHSTNIKDHYGVIEFDESFNLVDTYTISSGLTTNYYNNLLHFDPSGTGLISVFEYINSYEGNIFFGAFRNKQFQHQRKKYLNDVGMPGYNGFVNVDNNGYIYIQTYFQNQASPKSYVQFLKMHNSDTSSQCLGKDTSLLHFSSLNIIEDPGYYLLDPNEPNKMVSLQENTTFSNTLSTYILDQCKQTNFCDTVKIHGTSVICGNEQFLEFNAYKNPECGGIVQWNLDRSAFDSLRILTDTSVRIWFKHTTWNGNLYASLSSGACNGPVIDSISLNIANTQTGPHLGSDTTLCGNNGFTLHAGKSYSSYLWQDHSNDSVLYVTAPGMYSVQVSDFCGNTFSDTINISGVSTLINLGPDRTKCNNDTLHLNASAGFLNYSWLNNYNISSLSGQSVVVNPTTDTSYYIKAEKLPGCFAYDTVHITVNHSPSINLGPDKKLCFGDSAQLNAGSGFQNYAWSNGSNASSIWVKNTGIYSVTATTLEGCKSYDTLQVLQVYSLPVVHLDQGNALCIGETKNLDAGNFASYLWQDGSTNRSFVASGIGKYVVTVTDANGCRNSDSTKITTILPLPAHFLPNDTEICSYGTLELKPVSNYSSYLWSTGNSSPSITINKPGIYWLQVKDQNNCTGKDSIVVQPKQCLTGFYIPSAFTPNADGRNDRFRPMLFGKVVKYSFAIYNRWGQPVFQTTDLQKEWDGKIAGVLQNGVFAWICSYQFEGEVLKTEKGTVILIR